MYISILSTRFRVYSCRADLFGDTKPAMWYFLRIGDTLGGYGNSAVFNNNNNNNKNDLFSEIDVQLLPLCTV